MELKRLAEEGWEALCQTLLEGSAEAIMVLDWTGRIVDLNQQASENLGCARQELIGRSPGEFDASWEKAFPRGSAPRLAFKEPMSFRTTHRRKDGTVFPVHVRVVPVGRGANRLALVFSGDLSERTSAEEALQASEERFRTLVQLSFDVYWETDTEHRFTRQEFSPRMPDPPLPGSEIGKTRWEVASLEPDEHAWHAHRATMDAHLPFRDFELARPTAEGGKRYVSVSGFPVHDRSGRFVGYRGVGRHITPLKRAEAEHKAHLWFLESMDRINRAIQGTADLDRMMGDVLQAALDIFNCDRAWIVYPCDPCAPSWRVVTEKAKPEVAGMFAQGTDLPVDATKAAIFSAAIETPGPIPAGPAYQLDIPAPIAERFRIGSQMAMAVHAKADKPFLFALHQCAQEREWTAPEQRLFQEVGRRLGDAMAALSMLRNLGESKRKLDAAQRIAHLGWWERDFTTQRVSLSEEVQRIFGVPPVPLPGWQERWTNLIHPEDRARTAEAAAAALRGGPRYDVEYRVVRPDGSVRVVHSEGDVIYGDAGRPLRQFGVLQDVTELRQSERELSEIKERFRVLAESTLTGIYLTEQDRFTYVNPALAKMFGYEVEEIVGRRSIDLTCPDDRPLVDQNMRRRLQGAVEELRYEFRGLRKDGSVFPVEVHGRRIEHAGRIGVLGTLIDNTERRRAEDDLRASEARFRTFVDHARDGFLLMDEQLTLIDVNRQACESLGYRREELIGMHPRNFDAGLDDPAIARLAQRAGAGETLTFETVHRRKDGALLPVEIRAGHFMQEGQPFHLALVRDISERKRVEAELRASEAYLEEAQRLSHTGSWAFDLASNKYIYTSEESDRIYGFDPKGDSPTREAVLGRIHPEDRSSWERNLEKSLRERVDTSDEYRIVRPDGALRHIRTIRHPVLNSAGDVVQLVGTSIDITERKQAEEALRKSEGELRARQELLDLAQKAARAMAFDWHIGARERENHWSPELEAMYGLEPGTFDGTYQSWRKLLHPDDWPAVKAAIERANASGDVAAEYRIVHKDGSVHWLRARGRMFFEAGGMPERMVGFMFDVTDSRQAQEALRASEERFRTVFDRAMDAFFVFDTQLNVVDANRQACEVLGYSREELLGMHPSQFDARLDERSIDLLAHRALPGETITFETVHRRRDGTVFPVEVRSGTFHQGEQLLYLALARDIGERKRAEETVRAQDQALQTARAELARLSRLMTMGELTASIAHEVNQPLGAIVANAAAAVRWLSAVPANPAMARRALQSIADDGRRASEIIQRIRALVQRRPPRMAMVDVNETIGDVVTLTQQEMRSNRVVLDMRLYKDLPLVPADKIQLQQVLLNLILNAIEAMSAVQDRRRELTIASRLDGPGGVRVQVSDTGPGLAPEHAERLFEAFYTTKADGLGIGLSISRSIVEAHGGRLSAAQNDPNGAVFQLTLPVTQESRP